MSILPFIPKENDKLPDHYGATIFYITGDRESFDLASHRFVKESTSFELCTKEDIWEIIPLSSIKKIQFDKKFSSIIAIKDEMESKKNEKCNS